MPFNPRSAGSSRFRVDDVPATPAAIGALRQEFSEWTGRALRTTEGRLADINLVVHEALANCVEHAYDGRVDSSGLVGITAHYNRKTRSLDVSVRDDGTWLHRATPIPGRGRGIPIIHRLCDQPTFTSTPAGTTVDLHWTLFA